MKSLISCLILSALLTSTLPVYAQGTEVNIKTCQEQIDKELGRVEREYRTILFGRKKAEEAEVGEVRFDETFWPHIKIKNQKWIDADGLEIDDSDMDNIDEFRSEMPYRGILSTRHIMGSELIPAWLESLRTLECRSMDVCERVKSSLGTPVTRTTSKRIIQLQSPGCIYRRDKRTMPECHFADVEEVSNKSLAVDHCYKGVNELVLREQNLALYLFEYEAAYRALAQFAGNFELFLGEMRWTLTETLRKTVAIFGYLQRIPCFISACDDYPPDLLPVPHEN